MLHTVLPPGHHSNSHLCLLEIVLSFHGSTQCNSSLIVSQAFAVVRFLWHYAIPVVVFAFCYGRIFHTIRRQRKVVTGHAGHGHGHGQAVPKATTSRDQNTGQVQQQATGAKLTHTEMNVIKTMLTVIAFFVIFWAVPAFSNLLLLLGVSMATSRS